MPAGAKYCIIFGAFHVSSHAVLTCQLIVKEQNFNRIYVKIQWAFVGCACSGLHFTCREGKLGNSLAGWAEGLVLQREKTEGSRSGSNVRPGIWKLCSVCGLSTGNFIMQTEVSEQPSSAGESPVLLQDWFMLQLCLIILMKHKWFVSGLVQRLSQTRWPFETFSPLCEHLNIHFT